MDDFTRGQWLSLNRVLNYLNTLDTTIIDKKEIYHYVMDIRPVPLVGKVEVGYLVEFNHPVQAVVCVDDGDIIEIPADEYHKLEKETLKCKR